MKREFGIYLDDILESINKIEEYASGLKEKDFYEKTETQDAVLRRLEIIGEAVKELPSDIKLKYPKIPWREIAGTIDVLIHAYFGVNLQRIWKVIIEDLPELKKEINKIKQSLKESK